MRRKVGELALCAADRQGAFNSYEIKELTSYLSTPDLESNVVMLSQMSLLPLIATPTPLTAFALGEMLTRASRLISDLDFQLVNATSADSFHPKLGI